MYVNYLAAADWIRNEENSMKRKKLWIGILIALAFVAAIGVTVIIVISKADADLAKLNAAVVQEVDLTKADNGTFTGFYQAFPIDVEVQVVVEDHKILRIDLVKHTNGQGKPAEAIPAKVVEAQSLKVDMISGATKSSKAILLAIQDALSKS